MGTYSNTTHMRPEANTGPSVPYFGWFYPGTFYPPQKSSTVHSQGTQTDTQPPLIVPPIRSIAPTPEPAKNNSKSKTAKPKKPKPSVNRIPPKTKQPKKISPGKEGQNRPEAKQEIMNLNVSMMPSPICSCTGIQRVCYKWGAGGWQSSCCTKSISEHPLPMSSTRRGTRVAGRKMSTGAYLKLVLKLAAEGHDLSHPVDLKHHWAKHGTNKFVTIK